MNMKRLLSSAALMLVLSPVFSQCNELFISEYVEGDFFNKALELYNPTANPIDLAQYRLIRWDNGSTDADQPGGDGILNLSGTINPYSTFVVVVNTTLQGQETPPDPALAAKADAMYGTSCVPGTGIIRTLCFNGDDAISLQKATGNTYFNVDIFGSIGERPSNSQGTFSPTAGWTDIAPYSSMPAGYDGSVPYFFRYWTLDQTLKRKSSVETGIKINPDPETFNPATEWDSLPLNTFDSLGFHNCNCQLLGVQTLKDGRVIKLLPNPANEATLITAEEPIYGYTVLSADGRSIENANFSTPSLNFELNTSTFRTGSYLIQLRFKNAVASTRKLSVVH